ncbi:MULTISPECIES: hypothetical protein [unclassified Flavobacterium]|uniref:hypothetical protein n=1 Tax=unclassified Flavobacterium TaxID=196869 RepID=UPI00070CE5FA|nr:MULTISPECIES: hypothetical protein [unclassified Flavobacterium]KRD58621.1 hypothetical protein ASE40_20090 [Flavobacterium sp. Root935]TDX11330.1 hypothetical protein EDB96_2117 [Flavobacterium sp. S87F.05.LMB.W.Kidney.N]BDU25267.1 hypothetical protein FLGSB24_20110 [Flavobacterium sp. GSB-24]
MKKYIYLYAAFLFGFSLYAQEKSNGTFFFKLDDSYIVESKTSPNKFLLKDKNEDEVFYFKGVEIVNDLKPKEVLCLKDFVRTSKYYNKNKKNKLNNSELVNFFSNSTVYLVKRKNDKTEFIKVNPIVEIYD